MDQVAARRSFRIFPANFATALAAAGSLPDETRALCQKIINSLPLVQGEATNHDRGIGASFEATLDLSAERGDYGVDS